VVATFLFCLEGGEKACMGLSTCKAHEGRGVGLVTAVYITAATMNLLIVNYAEESRLGVGASLTVRPADAVSERYHLL
jgi:hypothetical protein